MLDIIFLIFYTIFELNSFLLIQNNDWIIEPFWQFRNFLLDFLDTEAYSL